MANVDHEFGGVSTELKLSVVENYLKAFTTALRRRFDQLWYIDAFAGTGSRTVRLAATEGNLIEPPAAERVEQLRGSARIALDIHPAFDRCIFIDQDPSHCDALRALAAERTSRTIEVLDGDANARLQEILQSRTWGGTRAVMFLDPYGMSVDWDTLQAVRGTEAIDVWYLVSLSGIFRQAARDSSAIDRSKRASLNRMFGEDRWEVAWYKSETVQDLFGNIDKKRKRTANVDDMELYVHERLGQLFPKVLKPLRLASAGGVPQFALFFAISNPDPKAIGLAQRMASHILNSGRASQVRPR